MLVEPREQPAHDATHTHDKLQKGVGMNARLLLTAASRPDAAARSARSEQPRCQRVYQSSALHAQRAVEADDVAVEIRVVDDRKSQLGVFARISQPRRERYRGAQGLLGSFG